MAVLLGAIFRPELRALFGSEPATSAATTVAHAPTRSAPMPPASTPASAPAPPPSSTPSARSEPAARPTEIDGKDASTWRNVLRGAVSRGDGAIAADAFVALARIDPTRFDDRKTLYDAVTAAHLAAAATPEVGDRVFDMLASNELDHHACDILYRITSVHGGSQAAKRAAILLSDETVLARGTSAMRIALEIRDTACKSRPALFDRAREHGDERALYLLQAMRDDACGQISCCMKGDAKLDQTVGAIRARIAEAR